MKTLTLTLFVLSFIAIGFHQAQSENMDDGGEMAMPKAMETKEMKMGSDTMEMGSDTMKMESDKMNTNSRYMVPTDAELRKRLSPLQYRVTQKDGTEPSFNNAYWDNAAEGIYVDIISGEPLFSSTDKYKSGTGWPSFTRPLDADNIVEIEDRSFLSVRTEVRSKLADSHLGHVFNDGPAPTGLRYCMNSASLRFVAKADLVDSGYGEYLKLFK